MSGDVIQILVTVVCSVLASSGLWALIQAKLDKNSAEKEMLLGLGHDRILALGMEYVDRGWITKEEYDNIYTYLYKPYEKLGGNGTAARIIDEVKHLPVKAYPMKDKTEA